MKNILIVDDDKEMTMILGDILETHHYGVTFAYDGLQAFEKTQKEKVDLILLDICMPYFTGFWFCDAFKNKPQTRHIPIVMMSGMPDEENRERALNLGAVAFLKKPFNPSELLKILKNTLD